MLPRPLQRLGWCVAVCGVCTALFGCSLWLDWNAYTDAGQANSSSSGGEGGAVAADSGVKESGGRIDGNVNVSDAADASDAADGNGTQSDASGGGDAAMDANMDASNPCLLHTCLGCCDPMNNCHFGTHDDSCGIDGGLCSTCTGTQTCSTSGVTMGTCSNSARGMFPSCSGGSPSTCPMYCGAPPFALPVCCRPDQTCGCLEFFSKQCL